MELISVVFSLVFFMIFLIHANWFFGGRWGLEQSLPTNEKGERVLNPKPIDAAFVALAFLAVALNYLAIHFLPDFKLLDKINPYFIWIVPSVFLIRAIGDFKYLGFFKKVKQTRFGTLDQKFYSPLCLILSVLGYINAWLMR